MTYQRQSLWAGVRDIISYMEFPYMEEIQDYQDELIDIEIDLPSYYFDSKGNYYKKYLWLTFQIFYNLNKFTKLFMFIL